LYSFDFGESNFFWSKMTFITAEFNIDDNEKKPQREEIVPPAGEIYYTQ